MLKMEESGPHQTAMSPYQVDASLHQVESRGSQHSNPFVSLQHRGDHEGSAHITHTSRSLSRRKGHVSHARNDRDMQREIYKLKEELRYAWQRHSLPNSELSLDETDDATYRQRSRTPPNETFLRRGVLP